MLSDDDDEPHKPTELFVFIDLSGQKCKPMAFAIQMV